MIITKLFLFFYTFLHFSYFYIITLWVLFIILAIIVYVLNKKDTNSRKGPLHKTVRNIGPDLEREKQVENQIKQVDPMFNKEESSLLLELYELPLSQSHDELPLSQELLLSHELLPLS